MKGVARNTRKRGESGKCTKGIKENEGGLKDKKAGVGHKRPNLHVT